ncbi:MAG: aminotransferase class I/II-fold pyridoxal phosphate-dependent enzyme, partial [candidate division WOR-3 bacterium]
LEIVNLGINYEIDPNSFKNHNIICIINPNNPTGNLQKEEVIMKAIEKEALVVIDEAYFPFSNVSYKHLINDYKNVYIIRSLSKSLLAGIRIGIAISNEDIVSICEEILTVPYHLSSLQLAILRNFYLIKEHLDYSTKVVNEEKKKIYNAFEKLRIEYIKSYTNFILFKVENPNYVYDELLKRGIRIRNISYMKGLENCLRVTIGKPDENEMFINSLLEIVA